jgi:hypothetical protein
LEQASHLQKSGFETEPSSLVTPLATPEKNAAPALDANLPNLRSNGSSLPVKASNATAAAPPVATSETMSSSV